MVDLKARPFYLTDGEIQWVEDTIASMTLEEKLSQLFVLLKAVPGVYFGIGAGEDAPGLHTPAYCWNDAVTEAALKLFTNLIHI